MGLYIFLTFAFMFAVHILHNEYVYVCDGKVSFVFKIVFVNRITEKKKEREGISESQSHLLGCRLISDTTPHWFSLLWASFSSSEEGKKTGPSYRRLPVVIPRGQAV